MTSSNEDLSISVIIITYNRKDLLVRTLQSLVVAASQAQLKLKINLVINGLCSQTQQLFSQNSQGDSFFESIELIQLESRISPAAARNIALNKVKTEWVLFLDDDVEVPINFLNHFLSHKKKYPQNQIIGGPNLTKSEWGINEELIGWILQEPLVSGPMAYRYRKGAANLLNSSFKISLCNLFVKTVVCQKFKLKPQFFTGEENAFFYHARKNNFVIKADDELFVWHKRRETLEDFFQQIEIYGIGRGQLIKSGQHAMGSIFVGMLFVGLAFKGLNFLGTISILATSYFTILLIRYSMYTRKINFKILGLVLRYWWTYFKGIGLGLWKKNHLIIQKKFAN